MFKTLALPILLLEAALLSLCADPEKRDASCFRANLRTSGSVLKQVTYSTDEACIDQCIKTEGCKAAVTSPKSWAKPGCYSISDYSLTSDGAGGWRTAERTCFETEVQGIQGAAQGTQTNKEPEVEWRRQEKNVWFPYAWDDVPLVVKTVSTIGSDDEIFFEVGEAARNSYSFARVVVRMSKDSIYYVQWCQNDTPLKNLPEAPDNVRVWKFIKHGFEGISIECNGVEVADLKFSEARPECSASKWTSAKVNFIKFNPHWDKTVGLGVGVTASDVEVDEEEEKDCGSLGCWKNENNRAINGRINFNSNIVLRMCRSFARARRFSVFAVQNETCFTGPDAEETYKRYGPSNDCKADGRGGSGAMNVYKICPGSKKIQ